MSSSSNSSSSPLQLIAQRNVTQRRRQVTNPVPTSSSRVYEFARTVSTRTSLSRPSANSRNSAAMPPELSSQRTNSVEAIRARGRARLVEMRSSSSTMITASTLRMRNTASVSVSSRASQKGVPAQKTQPRRSARLQSTTTTDSTTTDPTTTTKPSTATKAAKTTAGTSVCEGRLNLSRCSPGESTFYCPICFEKIKNTLGQIVALLCSHTFCRDCITACFQKKIECPVCCKPFQDPNSCMIDILL